jgi:hypothetical protein
LFKFFPINIGIHAAPQHYILTVDTPVPRLCPGIAVNDCSCDFQLPTPGGGIHEKKGKSEKNELAEKQVGSTRFGAGQIGRAGKSSVTGIAAQAIDVPLMTSFVGTARSLGCHSTKP